MAHSTPARRALAVAALAVVPWTVVTVGDVVTGFFPVFLLAYDPTVVPPLGIVPIHEFFLAGGRLPRNPELLPVSYVAYALALAGAVTHVFAVRSGRTSPVPERAVAGLLALSAVVHLGVAVTFVHRLRYTAIPVAPVLALAVAWWFYWPELRSLVLAPVGERDGG
jgi:uncharacterized protein (TIGR04206 family)